MKKERTYHFDVGDSPRGLIGFCAVVQARNKREAVKRLRETLPTQVAISVDGCIEYMNVYFNPDALAGRHIDWSAGRR